MLAVLLVCALAPTADPPDQREPLALLPITVGTDRPGVREGAQMLNAMLASRLGKEKGLRVITADELRELLTAESERQQFGCEDDGCLAELAGALGARIVATGQIVAQGPSLVWTESVVDQRTAQVRHTGSVRGASLSALGGQVEEMALQMLGQGAGSALKGAAAQARLGFTDEDTLASFRDFRNDNASLSTTEALTNFIIRHNVESDRLAVLQAVAFGSAALLVMVLGMVSYANLLAVAVFINPYMLLIGGVAALLLIPAALTVGAVGWGLAVFDALNIGRVEVQEDGCCRDDAKIADAEARSGLRDAAALAIILAGPAAVAGVFGGSMLYSVGYYLGGAAAQLAPALAPNPEALFPVPVVFGASYAWLVSFWCGLPLVVMPLLCGTPVGLMLLLWPPKPAVMKAAAPVLDAADEALEDDEEDVVEEEDAP